MAVIELDVYSGRINPTWEVDDSIVQGWLQALTPTEHKLTPNWVPTGIGYRGFIIRMNNEEIRVYAGLATSETRAWQYPAANSLENLLIDSGTEHIKNQKLIEYVKSNIQVG